MNVYYYSMKWLVITVCFFSPLMQNDDIKTDTGTSPSWLPDDKDYYLAIIKETTI